MHFLNKSCKTCFHAVVTMATWIHRRRFLFIQTDSPLPRVGQRKSHCISVFAFLVFYFPRQSLYGIPICIFSLQKKKYINFSVILLIVQWYLQGKCNFSSYLTVLITFSRFAAFCFPIAKYFEKISLHSLYNPVVWGISRD